MKLMCIGYGAYYKSGDKCVLVFPNSMDPTDSLCLTQLMDLVMAPIEHVVLPVGLDHLHHAE